MKQGEAPSILVFIPLMLSCNVDRLSNNNRVKVAPASTEWSNSTLTSDGWMMPVQAPNPIRPPPSFPLFYAYLSVPLHNNTSNTDYFITQAVTTTASRLQKALLLAVIDWLGVRACELDEVRPPNVRGSVTEASAATHTRITNSFTCSLPASRQPLQGTRTRTQARRIAISVAIDHPLLSVSKAL